MWYHNIDKKIIFFIKSIIYIKFNIFKYANFRETVFIFITNII